MSRYNDKFYRGMLAISGVSFRYLKTSDGKYVMRTKDNSWALTENYEEAEGFPFRPYDEKVEAQKVLGVKLEIVREKLR